MKKVRKKPIARDGGKPSGRAARQFDGAVSAFVCGYYSGLSEFVQPADKIAAAAGYWRQVTDDCERLEDLRDRRTARLVQMRGRVQAMRIQLRRVEAGRE